MILGETPQGEPIDYYYVNLQDWPTRHHPRGLSVQQIYDVLGRFNDVHGLAKSTQEQVDQANREIVQQRLGNIDPNNSGV
jgi:hypothetical protein